MILPIIIYIREKTKEELQQERKWRESIENEKERARQRIKDEEERKRREKEFKKHEIEKALNDEYYELLRRDEWQTRILPEGWSIFGQRYFGPISQLYEGEMPL